MKVLVNYDPEEKKFLGQLDYYIKKAGHSAVATGAVHEIGELIKKAKMSSCDAILLCNEGTLANLVEGKKPTLDMWRGSRLNFAVPVLVCNKLAHINTVDHGAWLLERDLGKLTYLFRKTETFTFEVLETSDKLRDPAVQEDFVRSIAVAYDVETAKLYSPGFDDDTIQGPNSIITCASWTLLMPDTTLRTYVLPLVDFGDDHWRTNEEYAQALHFLQAANRTCAPKVMHNGMYDCTHSIRYHAAPRNYVFDTMALAHAEFSELPKTLDFVASYTLPDYRQWKAESEEATKAKDIRRYWGYNAQDTWYTMRIFLRQLDSLPAYARRNYAEKFRLVYPSLYCAFEGLLLDNPLREKLLVEEQAKKEASLRKLRIMFADPNFNPGSWQQVAHYLYKIMGAKNPKIGKSSSGTDEKNLKAIAEQHPLLANIVEEILEYRGAVKAIGTYFTFQQLNGRLLYALNPYGTETERMACNSSSLWVGTQAQNIPKYAKKMLIADPGYELVECDNSQSEARCTAYCAQDEALIAALENKLKDFYKQLGTLFFNIPYEEVSDFFRNKVLKKIIHGTNYMMGAGTFIENIGAKILFETAQQVGITIVQVKRVGRPNEHTLKSFASHLLDLYHVPFNRVRVWYKKIQSEIATTHVLVSPLGHTRYFFGDVVKNHKILRSGVAHQPQNLSVTILNRGFWKVYKTLVLPSNGAFRLKAQVHDSILAQYKANERSIWLPKMLACMDNPVTIHGRVLRIPVDAKYGNNWYEPDMTKYKEAA